MPLTESEDSEEDEDLEESPRIRTLRLVYSDGQVPPYLFVTLDLGRTVLGRKSIEGFVLGKTVSERHAALELSLAGVLRVSKLGSFNKPVLNGIPIDKPEPMTEQAILKTGHGIWVYELEPESLSAPSGPNGSRTSVRMRILDAQLCKVAPTGDTVLILGETGTGKERTARAIHAMSTRCKGPFIAVNCAAIPPSMLEAVLFGHAKGAFTDAKSDRPGLFEQASGGTLFLDEIGDLSPAGQAALLRVFQERVVRRIGGLEDVSVDVRIVAATNQDLNEMAEQSKFRPELLHRLTHTIVLPPLRKRLADLLPLISEVWQEKWDELAPAFSPNAAQALFTYAWPGNVRELENRLAQLRVCWDPKSEKQIPARVVRRVLQRSAGRDDSALASQTSAASPIDPKKIDRAALLDLLRRQGSISGAARTLGVDRQNIRRLMKKHCINPADLEAET